MDARAVLLLPEFNFSDESHAVWRTDLMGLLNDEWLEMADEARGPWYDEVVEPRPHPTLFPIVYSDAQHRAVRAVLRGWRRMPRRGQLPDHHLPHAYHLGGWHGVELYRRWVESGLQPI